MKKVDKELKTNRKEEKVKAEKQKKEFKIEIVKVGKLEENTSGNHSHYECGDCME